MRKFRNNTIKEQPVDKSFCRNMRTPLVEPKTRLCPSSKECIVQIDSESTDNDFDPGMLALFIVLSLIIIITTVAAIIRIYFPHFVHLCLRQLHFH